MVGGDSGGGGVVAALVTFMQLVPSLFLFFVLVPAQHPNACKEHASLAGFVLVLLLVLVLALELVLVLVLELKLVLQIGK